MGSSMMMLAACGVALLGWLIYTVRAARVDAREALKGIQDLAEAFKNAHPYSGPSAAAVVTPAPASGPREAPAQLPEPAYARAALASDARERQLPPGAASAPPVDTEGDRPGVNPDAPAPDTDREPPRAAPLAVAQALDAPPGMVGLSLDESDAAQAPEVPARRSMLTEHPSEPPPAGVQSVPHPVDASEARARWGRTLRRHPVMDEVTARGTLPVPTVTAEAHLSAEDLTRVDRLAAARGISREAMIASLAHTGIAGEEHRAGPTTPPGAPANDADEAPASGRQRI